MLLVFGAHWCTDPVAWQPFLFALHAIRCCWPRRLQAHQLRCMVLQLRLGGSAGHARDESAEARRTGRRSLVLGIPPPVDLRRGFGRWADRSVRCRVARLQRTRRGAMAAVCTAVLRQLCCIGSLALALCCALNSVGCSPLVAGTGRSKSGCMLPLRVLDLPHSAFVPCWLRWNLESLSLKGYLRPSDLLERSAAAKPVEHLHLFTVGSGDAVCVRILGSLTSLWPLKPSLDYEPL